MKKILILFISIISLFGLTGCGTKYETYDRIGYLKFTILKEQGKTFPLVIGSATCSACQMYEVTMEAFIKKNNIQVYFIDLDQLSDEDEKSLRSEVNFESTPTTVFYKDGKITSASNDNTLERLVGAGSMQDVKAIFNSHGYKVK